MTSNDPLAGLRRAQIAMRITQRVVRAWRLSEWAFLRQVNPDNSSTERDAAPFMPDDGSSLARDDEGFMPALGTHVVSSTARFPVMCAAENLVGAGQAHGAAFKERRLASTSVASLCRCAFESSAKTLWLLSETSRDVRRARCLGFNEKERQYQQPYIDIEHEVLTLRTDPQQSADLEKFRQHVADYDTRVSAITSLPDAARVRPPRGFEKIVARAAEWIDANPPPHAADEMPSSGMTLAAKHFYAYGSSFVHGYKWMTDYIGNEEDILRMVADGFGAAVIMTECAVALFEAQAGTAESADRRKKNYPHWLVPTVAAWSPRYQ
jgi:hypothetical protein